MTTRDKAIEAVERYFDAGEFLKELATRVAVPSSSREEEHKPDLFAYLDDLMRPRFEAMGFDVHIHANPILERAPFLVARRIEDPSLPTLFCYGHGDTVPGEEGRWKDGRDPWVLARDGERVYGRGTADNKGQHSVHMGALRAVIETRGRLGFNSKFMIETGEENGSKGLKQLVADNKTDFAADVYFASDGPRVDLARPNLTLGCRGTHNLDLMVELREGGHHSGNWGGLLANPGVILSHAISTIVDVKGRILVEGLRPPPISNSVREALKDVKREGGPGAPEIDPDWGEPGLTAPEKVYAWNTFEVLAFRTGNPDRPVNAVPPMARANCQLRYVLGTDPDAIRPVLRKHLDEHGFSAIKIIDPPPGNDALFAAARTDPDHPWARWMLDTVSRVAGETPNVLPNSGGSICNDVFQDVLGIPFVWLPLSYTGCSQHAPNEHIIWPLTRDGMRLVTGVYWELGDPQSAYRPQ